MRRSDLMRRIAVPLGIYAASRVAIFAVAYAARIILEYPVLTGAPGGRWDGAWFVGIARFGYFQTLHPIQSDIAFFPAYPISIRAVTKGLGIPYAHAGVAISIVAGGIAAVLLWQLAERLADPTGGGIGTGSDRAEVVHANRAVALFSFFPGAYAFSLVYSDGLFLAAAIGCFLALITKRWGFAGAAALIAGATRPNGLVLVAVCVWAAVAEFRKHSDWRAFLAPILAPLGAAAYLLFLFLSTGNPFEWVSVQRRGWGQEVNFGASAADAIRDVAASPLVDPNRLVRVFSLALVLLGVVLLIRWRPHPIWWIYSIGIVAPVILSADFSLTPRTVLTAFPFIIAAARTIRGPLYSGTLAFGSALMGALVLLQATSAFTP